MSMRVVVLVAGLCAAVVLHAPAAMAQPATDADRRPGAWIAAVRAHEPGQPDHALLTVAAWTQAEIERILPSVAGDPDATRLMAKALVLHADIGILEQAGAVTGGGIRVMTLEDGRASGNRRLSLQWRIGRTIAGFLVALPVKRPGYEPPDAAEVERERRERLEVLRRWYRATAALLQEGGHLGFLQTHLGTGLSHLGDDAVLLMYRATLRQAFADARVQQFTRNRPISRFEQSSSAPRGLVTQPQPSSFELDQAVRDLRRALELDPQLVEARIRLAHVLGDKGRHDEAASLLRPAMVATLPAFLEYYGALVLGRVEERLGRLPEARAAFERAGRCFPDAQVPRVAISRLALLEGRPDEALAGLLAGSRASGPESPEDPWWWYFRSHEPDARSLIARMREAGR
jgi:tetratricopeptide (TPR) repeat protein